MMVFLKNLLVLLLALAVPVQGMAAASMKGCAQGHSGGQFAAAPGQGDGVMQVANQREQKAERLDQHAHVHAPGQAPHIHFTPALDSAMTSTFVLDSAAPMTALSGINGDSSDGPATCSACATCCVGAILISSGFASAEHPPLLPQFSTSGLVVSFITDGPQRPPRYILA